METTASPFGAPTGSPTTPTGEPLARVSEPNTNQGQGFLKAEDRPADTSRMSDVEISMHHLLDHVVDRVPGVLGALVSSADGHVLASRLTHVTGLDPAAIAAMSAAVLGLSNRLVQLTGTSPASFSHQCSTDGQVFVFGISHVAVLTVLTDPTADATRIKLVGREVGRGLERLFRGTANV
jgi:predicted regulator of Ras-like GTPase activity (Roadblock/LC7/MglB family)